MKYYLSILFLLLAIMGAIGAQSTNPTVVRLSTLPQTNFMGPGDLYGVASPAGTGSEKQRGYAHSNLLSQLVGTSTNVIYVDAGATSDVTDGRNPFRPFKTLSNAWVAAKNGDTILVRAGNYTVPTSLISSNNLTNTSLKTIGLRDVNYIAEPGATLNESGKGRMWTISQSSNIFISGFTFQGFASNRIGDTGDLNQLLGWCDTNKFITIQDCKFLNCYSFGCGFASTDNALAHFAGDWIRILRCYFLTNGTSATTNEGTSQARGAGMSVGGSHYRIEGCQFIGCDRDVELTPAGQPVLSDFKYLNNFSDGVVSIGIMSLIASTNFNDILIADNTWTNMMGGRADYFTNFTGSVTNSSPVAIQLNGGSNIRVVNNSFFGSGSINNRTDVGGGNIVLPNVGTYRNLLIAGNVSKNNQVSFCPVLGTTYGMSIIGNMSENDQQGINISGTDILIANNTILGTTPNYPIFIQPGTTNAIITGNRVNGSTQAGLTISATAVSITEFGNDLTGNAAEVSNSGTFRNFKVHSNLQLGSGAYLTNETGRTIYFATNATASNGSIYLDSSGILWLRTNGTWIIK